MQKKTMHSTVVQSNRLDETHDSIELLLKALFLITNFIEIKFQSALSRQQQGDSE